MEKSTTYLAKHLRDVYFGGNWTAVNFKDTMQGVSWKQALYKIENFNTIAQLTYHIHYFAEIQRNVLKGGPLEGSDALSFDHPSITSEEEWGSFLHMVWETAEDCANSIETLSENTLHAHFGDPKYGTYYRNLLGVIEHTHYHLGQIVLIKKMVPSIL